MARLGGSLQLVIDPSLAGRGRGGRAGQGRQGRAGPAVFATALPFTALLLAAAVFAAALLFAASLLAAASILLGASGPEVHGDTGARVGASWPHATDQSVYARRRMSAAAQVLANASSASVVWWRFDPVGA